MFNLEWLLVYFGWLSVFIFVAGIIPSTAIFNLMPYNPFATFHTL